MALVFAASAFADHQGGGGVDNLVQAARNLNQTVRYSSLRYAVKSSVYSFTYQVESLDRCIDGARLIRPEIMDHEGANDHTGGGVPPQCQYQLNNVRNSFGPVDRYLNDTYYDYPQVYQAYQYAQSALYAL